MMASAVFGEPLVSCFVAGAILEPVFYFSRQAQYLVNHGEPLLLFFVAGAIFGELLIQFFAAGAVFAEPLVAFWVAGAIGELLILCFVAGARNLKLQVTKRVAKRSIVTLESNTMLVFRGRRNAKVEIVTLDTFKKKITYFFFSRSPAV